MNIDRSCITAAAVTFFLLGILCGHFQLAAEKRPAPGMKNSDGHDKNVCIKFLIAYKGVARVKPIREKWIIDKLSRKGYRTIIERSGWLELTRNPEYIFRDKTRNMDIEAWANPEGRRNNVHMNGLPNGMKEVVFSGSEASRNGRRVFQLDNGSRSGTLFAAAEQRPATSLSERNWGKPAGGLQVSLSVYPRTWKIGDRIKLVCAVKNASSTPLHVEDWGVSKGGMPNPKITRSAKVSGCCGISLRKSNGKVLHGGGGTNLGRKFSVMDYPVIEPGKTRVFTAKGYMEAKRCCSLIFQGSSQRWPATLVKAGSSGLAPGNYQLVASTRAMNAAYEFLEKSGEMPLQHLIKYEKKWPGTRIALSEPAVIRIR